MGGGLRVSPGAASALGLWTTPCCPSEGLPGPPRALAWSPNQERGLRQGAVYKTQSCPYRESQGTSRFCNSQRLKTSRLQEAGHIELGFRIGGTSAHVFTVGGSSANFLRKGLGIWGCARQLLLSQVLNFVAGAQTQR